MKKRDGNAETQAKHAFGTIYFTLIEARGDVPFC